MPEIRGFGLDKGGWPARPYSTVKAKALSNMDGDIKALMKSLTSVNDRMSFYRLTTQYISHMLIAFCKTILVEAARKAPYRSGELRDSGKVVIRTGQKQTENIAVDIRADKFGTVDPRQWITSIKRPAALITAEISFERTDRGKDVALWAHEELLPHTYRADPGREALLEETGREKICIATKEGTGPKYLEGPYNKHIGRLAGRMQLALGQAITKYNRHTGQRVRRRS